MAFVVRYRRSAQTLLGMDRYDSSASAYSALRHFERQFRSDDDVEVVLLTAPSEAELRQTHGRYFGEPTLVIGA